MKFEGKLENENTLYKVISNYYQNGICKLHLWNVEKKQISFVHLAMCKHYTLANETYVRIIYRGFISCFDECDWFK